MATRFNGELQRPDVYSEFRPEHLQDLELLHNLYGVEVSTCTGNARRISLIDLIFTTPLKRYLESILQGSSSFIKKVLAAIEKKDPIDFLGCYTNYTDGRDDFVSLLNVFFAFLADTGVDSRGNLNALYISKSKKAFIVTLPKKSYPWAEILEDSVKSFTLAVLTDTCLSAHGRACIRQRESWTSHAILETRLWFPGISVPSTPLTASTLSDRYLLILPQIADQRLPYVKNMPSRGYLKIIEGPLRHLPQSTSNPPQAFLARWTQTKKDTRRLPNTKQSHFSECLVEDGRRYFLTYITSDVENRREKTE
ncbi:beta transducin het-e4s protein [Rutstroemia sp. NJR-2017a BBW]|nr:beta transducin het-e4s protein [Rutstroemia sp. NJR-2017a BBW]